LVGKKNFHTDTHTDTRHPAWLSHASQYARSETKNKEKKEEINASKIYSPSGKFAERANYGDNESSYGIIFFGAPCILPALYTECSAHLKVLR